MTDYDVVNRKLEFVIKQNNALIDMLGSLIKAYANHNELALENNEEECEYIDAIKGFNK